jgi:hypothetical protein
MAAEMVARPAGQRRSGYDTDDNLISTVSLDERRNAALGMEVWRKGQAPL